MFCLQSFLLCLRECLVLLRLQCNIFSSRSLTSVNLALKIPWHFESWLQHASSYLFTAVGFGLCFEWIGFISWDHHWVIMISQFCCRLLIWWHLLLHPLVCTLWSACLSCSSLSCGSNLSVLSSALGAERLVLVGLRLLAVLSPGLCGCLLLTI